MDFLSFLSASQLFDAGFTGSFFTWCNNQNGAARISKRLDRLVLNVECADAFTISVSHLSCDLLEHPSLIISVAMRLDNKPRPFRFLDIWTSHSQFLHLVQKFWKQHLEGGPIQVLCSKMH